MDEALRQELVDFWLGNNAIMHPDEAVFIARDAASALVGVCTIYLAELAPGEPYYFYRMPIQRDHRIPGMERAITRAAREYLGSLEMENKPLGACRVWD